MSHPNPIVAAIDAADFADLDIKPAYIDGNGHMNVGYYSVLFDRALERYLRPFEVGWDFMQTTGKTGFVLEHHTRYMREVKQGDPLAFTFELVDWDTKRMHHLMTMRHATEGWVASVQEAIAICVDVATRRTGTWLATTQKNFAEVHAVHSQRPRSPDIGRSIRIPHKTPPVRPAVSPALLATTRAELAAQYMPARVLPEWIDRNGHMNAGYYSVVFDLALDPMAGMYSLSWEDVKRSNMSMFVLESHVFYYREAMAGDPLVFDWQLLDYDEKRFHYFVNMRHAERGDLLATSEQIAIYVDLNTRRPTTWPTETMERFAATLAVHSEKPRPTEAGHVIGIRRSAAA